MENEFGHRCEGGKQCEWNPVSKNKNKKKTKNKETKPFPGVRKMAQCLRSLTLALGPSIYMQAHDRL